MQASALLHRAQRREDNEGQIIAELADYAVAIAALGDGLAELKHGDTDKLEQVRQAVAQALRQKQREWWRTTMTEKFKDTLVEYCHQHKLQTVAQRIFDAKKTQGGRERLASATGCVAVATENGRDPALLTAAGPQGLARLCRRLLWSAGKETSKNQLGKPLCVELSSQALASALGIGRKAARVRLDNAIEIGAVVDMSEERRPRTAPRSLAPGKAVTAANQRRGAFPPVDQVRKEWERYTSG